MPSAEQRDEVEMLWLMLLIRRFEERASQQYQAQKIGGFCHLYIGQEAVVTGALAAIRFDDYIITAYRDHAHALYLAERQVDLAKAAAQLQDAQGKLTQLDREHDQILLEGSRREAEAARPA